MIAHMKGAATAARAAKSSQRAARSRQGQPEVTREQPGAGREHPESSHEQLRECKKSRDAPAKARVKHFCVLPCWSAE